MNCQRSSVAIAATAFIAGCATGAAGATGASGNVDAGNAAVVDSAASIDAPLVASTDAAITHDDAAQHDDAAPLPLDAALMPPTRVDASLPDAATPDAAPAAAACHNGLTFHVLATDPAGFLVVYSSSNPYSGDTPCSAVIPMLCILVDNSAEPSPYNHDTSYQAWSNGRIELTTPISGSVLTSQAAGDAICASQIGVGWAMAEFHDGSATGGIGWGFGAYPDGPFTATNFWTAIRDQPANPWDPVTTP